MVLVPAGNFRMGESADRAEAECKRVSSRCEPDVAFAFTDEEPIHTVYLKAFWIDRTEVTNAMYSLCVQDGGCTSNEGGSNNYPAVNVSWLDGEAYCTWRGKRLPTEAEWEKAARGSDMRTFPWGSEAPSCSLANSSPDSGGGSCARGLSFAGSYPHGASPYGALDMAGNAREWVADWFDLEYYAVSPKTNPQGPTSGSYRSMRGGSFINPAGYLRVTNRAYGDPENKDSFTGFRCAGNQ